MIPPENSKILLWLGRQISYRGKPARLVGGSPYHAYIEFDGRRFTTPWKFVTIRGRGGRRRKPPAARPALPAIDSARLRELTRATGCTIQEATEALK